MPSAVFDYDEIRKRVRADYLFGREARRAMSAPDRAASSTVGTSAVTLCDWCGKGGSDAEGCPHNRNTGGICAIYINVGRVRLKYVLTVIRPPQDQGS
jgi:hypothetical protein